MPAKRSLFCLKLRTTINASPYRARASRPSAPLRNGIFLLMAQPRLEKEGNGPVSQLNPFPRASFIHRPGEGVYACSKRSQNGGESWVIFQSEELLPFSIR